MQEQTTSKKNITMYLWQGLLAAVLGAVSAVLIFRLEQPLFAFAGVLAIFFALVTVTNVDFGLFVLVFISYARFSDVLVEFHGTPSIAKPYIGLLIASIAIKWFLEQRISSGWERSALLVFAYGIVVFSSLLHATDFDYAMGAVLNFLKDGIIAVIIVILMRDWKDLRGVVWTLVVVGFFLGTISTVQGLAGLYDQDFGGFGQVGFQNIVGETEGNRLSGPVGDPNFYAQSMLVLLPLALNRFLREKRLILRLIAGWAFLSIFLAVIFSYSRGAAVAMVMMLVFNMLHSPPKITDAVIALLVVVILVSFVPNAYVDRLATLPDVFGGRSGVLNDVSFRGRASEVMAAWLMFLDYPIVGVGVENYPVYYQNYSRRLGLDPRIEERHAHNLYLQVAAETGLAGILIFGYLLITMLKGVLGTWRKLKLKKRYADSDLVLSMATGVVGYLSAAMFIHSAYPRYFWVLVGISLAIPGIVERELKRDKKDKYEHVYDI